jgi:predicted GNAT family N-acyltransferase
MQPPSLQVLALESGGKKQGTDREATPPRRVASPGPVRCVPEWIHGAVQPADVRPGDPITAQVRLPGRPEWHLPSRVWRLSPLGVELVRPRELPRLLVGTPLDLSLRIGASVSDFPALPLLATGSERGHELLAFSWGQRPGPEPARAPRAASRWPCEPGYVPTGIAPSAVRFEDFVYFRVVDVSRSGMQLETSLRNKFLVPGVQLETTCTFPTQGQLHLDLRVVHARVAERGSKKVLALGVTYSPRSPGGREIIGQYLLQFAAGATIQELRAHGFHLRSSSQAIDFDSLRTDEEYGEVLRLRRLAYVHARKVSADAKDVDMADAFDAHSRILVAKHRGQVVGTARLMFPDSETDRLNHEEFLELPPGLPPRTELVEVFKTCTHPGYRGSDLFYALLQHVALVIVQSGRRYALMSATDSLAPIYQRFGFRPAGASYEHPGMRMRHHLMLLDVARVIEGVGVSPLYWNLMRGWEVWRFGRMCGVVATDPWTTARVHLWRLLRPAAHVVRMVYERRLRRRERGS